MSDLTHEINFLRREVRDARVISRVIIHRSKLSTSASLPRAPLTCSELEKITQPCEFNNEFSRQDGAQ
jgi:hypothetical protein